MSQLPPWRDPAELVRARLFERRLLVVSGSLDDGRAGDLAAELLTLDATGDEAVALHLENVDASLGAALALMDTVDLLGVPLHVTCLGTVEGPAVGVVAVAQCRRIAPHARLRLCDPHVSFAGRASDMERWAAHHEKQLHALHTRVAEASGRPLEHVEADFRTGRFLDATEAVAYGLVDEVSVKPAIDPRAPRTDRPFGFGPYQ